MWLYGQKALKVSHYSGKFGGHKHCGSGDIILLVCHAISQDHTTKGLSNYGWKSLKESHHPAKFGDHRHCDSGDIIVLVCHFILQGLLIKGSSKYRQGSFKVSYHPAGFCGHSQSGSREMFWFVTWSGKTMWSRAKRLYGWEPLMVIVQVNLNLIGVSS